MADNTFSRHPLLWLAVLIIIILLVVLVIIIATREEDQENSCVRDEAIILIVGIAAVMAAFAIGWYLGTQSGDGGPTMSAARRASMMPKSVGLGSSSESSGVVPLVSKTL